MQTFITNSERETEELGAKLAGVLHGGNVVAMFGDLGSGKTALVRGMARGMGLKARVTSPTFTIVNEYIQKIVVHAPDKSSGRRRQKIQIFFNFLGEFNLPTLNEPVIIENTPKNRKTA